MSCTYKRASWPQERTPLYLRVGCKRASFGVHDIDSSTCPRHTTSVVENASLIGRLLVELGNGQCASFKFQSGGTTIKGLHMVGGDCLAMAMSVNETRAHDLTRAINDFFSFQRILGDSHDGLASEDPILVLGHRATQT